MLRCTSLVVGACTISLFAVSVAAVNCWVAATTDCCGSIGFPVPPTFRCSGGPEELCSNYAIVSSPTINRSVAAKEGESGKMTVVSDGTSTCTRQLKWCIDGKCQNNGVPVSFTCFADLPNPDGVNCQGPPPD